MSAIEDMEAGRNVQHSNNLKDFFAEMKGDSGDVL
jgi:hypothetical protein